MFSSNQSYFHGFFWDLPYLVMSQWDPALGLALSHMGVTNNINQSWQMGRMVSFFLGPL